MIRGGKNDIIGIHVGGSKVVIAVRQGLRLVWELVSSCFGAGYWRGEQRWKGSDGWRRG